MNDIQGGGRSRRRPGRGQQRSRCQARHFTVVGNGSVTVVASDGPSVPPVTADDQDA